MIPVIPDVNNGIKKIPDISIPSYITNPPSALPIYPPVTTEIGVPVVNLPGCVEAHKDSSENQTLTADDDDGLVTYCDAGAPNFYPIDYDASRIEIKQQAPKPPSYKAPEPKPPAVPKANTPNIPKTKKPDCPSDIQALTEPIGKVIGDQVVVEHRLVMQGNNWVCITVKRDIDIPTQVLENIPSAGAVTATASIAVVATTSALLAKPLADLLLKVVKPVTKKVVKKIAALRGKKPPVLSATERKAEQRDRNRAIKILRSALKPKG